MARGGWQRSSARRERRFRFGAQAGRARASQSSRRQKEGAGRPGIHTRCGGGRSRPIPVVGNTRFKTRANKRGREQQQRRQLTTGGGGTLFLCRPREESSLRARPRDASSHSLHSILLLVEPETNGARQGHCALLGGALVWKEYASYPSSRTPDDLPRAREKCFPSDLYLSPACG